MDYEQKYTKALWQMNELYNRVKYMSSPEALLTTVTLENTFPELAESEDEKIRKGLIKGLYAMRDIHKHQTFSDDAVNIDDAIAWLEKQGKQDVLKSLPKWKKFLEEYEELDSHVILLEDNERVVLTDYLEKWDYYIELSDLKTLHSIWFL